MILNIQLCWCSVSYSGQIQVTIYMTLRQNQSIWSIWLLLARWQMERKICNFMKLYKYWYSVGNTSTIKAIWTTIRFPTKDWTHITGNNWWVEAKMRVCLQDATIEVWAPTSYIPTSGSTAPRKSHLSNIIFMNDWNTFSAYNKACSWLLKNWYSYWSMQWSAKVWFKKWKCYIGKWRNLSSQNISDLDGYITSTRWFRSNDDFQNLYYISF